MAPTFFSTALAWALTMSLVSSSPSPAAYKVRNAPGLSTTDTIRAIHRELSTAKFLRRDTELSGNVTLDRSWDEAVLLKFGLEKTVSETNNSETTVSGGVEIVCTKCYIKGLATAELKIEGDFNASQAIEQTLVQVHDKVENFTETVDDYFANYTKGVVKKFDDGIDIEDFAFPTFPYDFGNLTIPAIPDINLRFQFDGMELYVQTTTALSLGATYTLNLYSSNTPLGIHITKDLELGVIFAIDLILSVEGQIDISSGFHIELDDGLEINIAMFGDDVSDIIFNGGKYEFLPVTIESAGIVFSAILRLGVHAGFNLVSPDFPEITIANKTVGIPSVGGGIEVGVFANVAEFITNVTVAPEDKECKVEVVQSYQIAIGAAAGMTVAFDTHTWGPVAATSVPIYYTELGALCAIAPTATSSIAPTITPRAVAGRQEDLTTTTTVTKVTYTGVSCASQGLVNCPVSLQETTQSVELKTLTASVKSGEEAVWTEPVANSVVATVPFGSKVQSLSATTGKPISYVPPPVETTSGTAVPKPEGEKPLDGEVGGVSKKVVVGVSVGLGIPIVIAFVAGALFLVRRKKYSAVPHAQSVPMIAEPYGEDAAQLYTDKPAKTGVNVREVEHR